MPLSNSEQEMLWVDAWNDLYDLTSQRSGPLLVDAEWRELTLEEAKGEIQDQAYRSRQAHLEPQWYRGKRALQLTFSAV